MTLPVLLPEYFVYHHMQKLAVVRVYRQSYHVLDNSKITSIIFTADDHILRQQQCLACDGIQSTQTTAQVVSFESPPWYMCFHRGLQKLAMKHLTFGMREMWRAFSMRAQVKQLQRFIPTLRVQDVMRSVMFIHYVKVFCIKNIH